MGSKKIKVLIADDHLIIRQGLRLILETSEDIVVAGEASNGLEAVEGAERFSPDVILMDLRMPVMDGMHAIEQLQQAQTQSAIVILTNFNEDELMIRGLRAGAKGFLLKDTDRETLLNTIRAAARGETLLQPEVMARLMAHAPVKPVKPSEFSSKVTLTERENEVLQAVACGQRSKEIAFALGITERTVKAHIASIFARLGVDSRAAAIAAAARLGMLEDEKGQE